MYDTEVPVIIAYGGGGDREPVKNEIMMATGGKRNENLRTPYVHREIGGDQIDNTTVQDIQ